MPRPDLSLPEVREWWSDVAAEAMRQEALDGLFVDALPQVLSPALRAQVGEDKARSLANGAREMLALARQKMGAGKVVLANGIRAGEHLQVLDWEGISGVVIEHFGHFQSASKEAMKADLDSMALCAAKGKSVVLKGWPEFSWLDEDMMQRPHAELLAVARERITFPLACYLAAAQPNSYFCYSWGYTGAQGTLDTYPEFDRPLGPPLADAAWHGFAATREFAHASVRVDLAGRKAAIDWKSV